MKTKRGLGPGTGLFVVLVLCSLCAAQQIQAGKSTSREGGMQDRALQPLKNHPKTIKPADAISSIADGVNDAGQIVGGFTDKNQGSHGFLYDNGTFQDIDFPGALWTEATGINNNGEIVGIYNDHTNNHGFTLINGSYSTFDFPGAQWTQLQAVNDQGWFTGNFGMPDGTFGAFFWDGSSVKNISYPGPGTSSAYGINNAGDIVGQYSLDSALDGFLYHQGAYSLITLPGVQLSQKIHFIEAIGINNRGDIAGSYIDDKDKSRAYDLKGTVVTTIMPIIARAFGVNADQEVVGYSTAKDGTNRGFAVIAKDPATIGLGSDKNPSKVGEAVTFTATVAGGNAVATGAVSFMHGKTVLGSASLANGQATFTTTFTKAGTVPVFAAYSGDENYFDGKSPKVKQVVTK